MQPNNVSVSIKQLIKKFPVDKYEGLYDRIEQFSTDIVRYIDFDQLSHYLKRFCKQTFAVSRFAIMTLPNVISPYKINYEEGFSKNEIQSLLSRENYPLLEKIEFDRQVLIKFELPGKSRIYKILDALQIDLGIPLQNQQDLTGIILMGLDRQKTAIQEWEIYFFKLMSSQISFAIENIRTIQNIVQAQKMAGLGMLASQLAHDFRSFIAVTKNQIHENPRLVKQANYMEKMVQDLLSYARPRDLKMTGVDIHHLIDMSLDMVQFPPEIKIEKHYAAHLPKIKLDVHQMRKVFANLFQNSVRAMRLSDNNLLKITTRPLSSLSRLKVNPGIEIEFLDEGIGIPEEFLERIFDPFFTTHKNEGSNGLGLAIVKQIISRHSGYIDVSSKPGKGAVFNIRLPHHSA